MKCPFFWGKVNYIKYTLPTLDKEQQELLLPYVEKLIELQEELTESPAFFSPSDEVITLQEKFVRARKGPCESFESLLEKIKSCNVVTYVMRPRKRLLALLKEMQLPRSVIKMISELCSEHRFDAHPIMVGLSKLSDVSDKKKSALGLWQQMQLRSATKDTYERIVVGTKKIERRFKHNRRRPYLSTYEIYENALKRRKWPLHRFPDSDIYWGPGCSSYHCDMTLKNHALYFDMLLNNKINAVFSLGKIGRDFESFEKEHNYKKYRMTIKGDHEIRGEMTGAWLNDYANDFRSYTIQYRDKSTSKIIHEIKVYNLEVADIKPLGISSVDKKNRMAAIQCLKALYHHNQQGRIYIHCHLGKGRSSTLLLGLLCYNRMDKIPEGQMEEKIQWIKDNIVIPCREMSPGMIHTAEQLYEGIVEIPAHLVKVHQFTLTCSALRRQWTHFLQQSLPNHASKVQDNRLVSLDDVFDVDSPNELLSLSP